MSCFGSKQLVTLCFWYFGPNLGPQGQKKAILGQNRVCRKVHFPKNCHPKSCLYRTKTHVGDHILIWNIDFSGNALKNFHDGWFSVLAHRLPSLDEIGEGLLRQAGWHPKHFHTVCLGGTHPHHALEPLNGPLRHSWGPLKVSFWPQNAIFGAQEVLGRPRGARFGPNCHRYVRLSGTHGCQILWPGFGPFGGFKLFW